jgi:hypothetical protein
MINPMTGAWAKMEEDDGAEPDPTRTPNQPIVPWVMDRKNALLLQLAQPDAGETTIATLQYALKRGIESVYQLEESELLAEPLPDRKNRHGVLFYEATEGGAGVLTRLVHDEHALAGVARAALKVMHFDLGADGEPLPTAEALHDVDGTQCVAGCYRCVLSYYNQPDHPVIDRRDKAAQALLLRLAAVRTQLAPHSVASGSAAGPDAGAAGEPGFRPAAAPGSLNAADAGLPEPSAVNVQVGDVEVLALWRAERVALVAPGTDPAPLQDRGLDVVTWPTDDATALQAAIGQLKQHLS